MTGVIDVQTTLITRRTQCGRVLSLLCQTDISSTVQLIVVKLALCYSCVQDVSSPFTIHGCIVLFD